MKIGLQRKARLRAAAFPFSANGKVRARRFTKTLAWWLGALGSLYTGAAPLPLPLPLLLAEDAGYEPFAAYNLDQTLSNAAQPAPPATTGMLDYTSSNQFLTEYVFAMNPTLADLLPFSHSVATADVGNGPEQFLQLEFTIRTNDAQVTHRVEVSGDLFTWNHNGDGSGPDYTEILSTLPNGDGTTTYIVRIKEALAGGGTGLFARLSWTTY